MEIKRVKQKPIEKKKSFFKRLKNINWKKIITYTPRIIAILYIIFITIFAFNEPTIDLPWFVNLMPTLILTLIVIFTWKRTLAPAIIFLILGFGFTLIFKTYNNWLTFLVVSLPLILMGILFLLERLFVKKKDQHHKKIRKNRKEKLLMKK